MARFAIGSASGWKLKGIREILDFRREKSFRLGLLIASTLFTISASLIVYSGLIIERPLEVNNSGGPTTGATGGSPLIGTILILTALTFLVGFGVVIFLREAYRHIGNRKASGESSLASLERLSSGEDRWEEAPRKDEEEEASMTNP